MLSSIGDSNGIVSALSVYLTRTKRASLGSADIHSYSCMTLAEPTFGMQSYTPGQKYNHTDTL